MSVQIWEKAARGRSADLDEQIERGEFGAAPRVARRARARARAGSTRRRRRSSARPATRSTRSRTSRISAPSTARASPPRPAGPGLREPPARLGQVLRQHLHVRKHRHEVRVAGPARHDVQVDVVDHAGAGDPPEVPADVVPLRRVDLSQRTHAGGGTAGAARALPPQRARRTRRCGRTGATMKWPDEYGYLFSRAIACSPRCTTSRSSSSPATAMQKTQPGSSSADLMYSRRQGAHSCFTRPSLERLIRGFDRNRFRLDPGAQRGEEHHRPDHRQNHDQGRGEEDRLESEHVVSGTGHSRLRLRGPESFWRPATGSASRRRSGRPRPR